MNKVRVSQKLSLIGKTKKQIACVKGLGLRKINDHKIIDSTPENLGMINKVRHMLNIEEIKEKKEVKAKKEVKEKKEVKAKKEVKEKKNA